MRYWLCALIILSCQAEAINQSTVVNNQKTPKVSVGVVWVAWNCFEMHYGYYRVCKTVDLKKYKDRAQYHYNWGAWGDKIRFVLLLPNGRFFHNDALHEADQHGCTVDSPDKGVVYLDKIAVNKENGVLSCKTHIEYPKKSA